MVDQGTRWITNAPRRTERRLAICLAISAAIGAILLLVPGCGSERDQPSSPSNPAAAVPPPVHPLLKSSPLASRSPRLKGAPLFEALPVAQTGLQFSNKIQPKHPKSFLYHTATGCGGVAIGDVDGDDRPDVFVVSGPDKNKLFRNAGDFRFEDITSRAGVAGGEAWGIGVSLIDIDNDRDLDIYVCNFDSPNQLFVNRGDGTFEESARRFGIDVDDASLLAAFCDYDLDGDLDFYLLLNRPAPHYFGIGFKTNAKVEQLPIVLGEGGAHIEPGFERFYSFTKEGKFEVANGQDRLFRNDGDGRFTDVTHQAGRFPAELGLSATWWDYDANGWPDLYVGHDFDAPDFLFRNNGDGTFSDVIADVIPHTSWFSMGADAADINNDGLVDFLTADMSATTHFKQKTTMGAMNEARLASVDGPPPQIMRNALYVNSGTARFLETAYLAGLADTDWTWSVKFSDLDNDGRQDVLVTNGTPRDTINQDLPLETIESQIGRQLWDAMQVLALPRPEQNLAVRNLGNLEFEDASKTWGLDLSGYSYGAAQGDLDGDGDLDIVMVNLEDPLTVYRNGSVDAHRVIVHLRGASSNRFGIGAHIKIETRTGIQARWMMPGGGFTVSHEPTAHFGLGEVDRVDRITVAWPGGHIQTFERLPANYTYTITEPEGPGPGPHVAKPELTIFRPSEALASVQHRESPFRDFDLQPLLPNKLSQLGPGLAWGDADGDGDEDLFVPGAAGQAGSLLWNVGPERFEKASGMPWDSDAAPEDIAALWIDVEADGDLDLYVASGSYELDPDSRFQLDRLYINDGDRVFRRAPKGQVPDARIVSGGLAACDFDIDGDLDVFVGGRVIPGKYPLAPESRLLLNDGGTFRDVTDERAPGLRRIGMVTGALWSDVDADGKPDLLLTLEWGPVSYLHNVAGKFENRTKAAGLLERTGWWNGIDGGDLDGDGDIDYVVSNFGLNTKYHASVEHPTLLYYGDFEGNGRARLVEGEYEHDKLFPVRGRSCSTHAMPHLGEKYGSYKDFALASLEDIYTPTCLETAHRFAATTLESGILLNDGAGRFEFRPLPRIAQASPAFGIAVTDLDLDGIPDIYLAQNFFTPQPETGRMDGGVSLLLRGAGDGSFSAIWPHRSGLVVPGDGRGLTVCDLDRNGSPDLVVACNDETPRAFVHQGSAGRTALAVRLQGTPGNLTAIGARVRVIAANNKTQTAEARAGSGYLSQSSSWLFFGHPGKGGKVEIHWPDGETSTHAVDENANRMTFAQKERVGR